MTASGGYSGGVPWAAAPPCSAKLKLSSITLIFFFHMYLPPEGQARPPLGLANFLNLAPFFHVSILRL